MSHRRPTTRPKKAIAPRTNSHISGRWYRRRRKTSHGGTGFRRPHLPTQTLLGVGEGYEFRDRVAGEWQRSPVVAPIAACPDLSVGEAGEEPSVGGYERVGHRPEGLGQAAPERLPGLLAPSSIDECLRIASAVSGERPGARGDVPAVGIAGIDGDCPGVVAVAAFVGRLPGLAGV